MEGFVKLTSQAGRSLDGEDVADRRNASRMQGLTLY